MIVKGKRARGLGFYGPVLAGYAPSVCLALVLPMFPGQLFLSSPDFDDDELRCHSISHIYTYCNFANVVFQSFYCLVSNRFNDIVP